LIVRLREGDIELCVSPQVLAIDVDAALAADSESLSRGDADLIARVETNHVRWVRKIENLDRQWITPAKESYVLSQVN
jgi:hypothetical protein